MTKVILLDGGMGQELIARSAFPPSPLWSAKVLLDEPDIVRAVHEDYIEAGAAVITLNTYSATPERLARDASEELFEPLQAKAIEAAKAAKGDTKTSIAGCLSPLFGSYHPDQAPEFEKCLETNKLIAKLQAPHCDFLLCETLASVKEIKAAVQAGVESGKTVICGMTVMDQDGTKLRSGESVSDGIEAAKTAGATAVGINCSWPEAVTQAIPVMKASGLPFGGWANGFTKADDLQLGGTVDVLKARADLGPDQYADFALSWVEQGATIVGGCCEVGPAHINRISQRLIEAGHTISGDL